MSTELEEQPKPAAPTGALSFALLCFFLAAWLLWNIGDQTKWVNGKVLTSQPRFWPAVTLSFMVIFAGLHILSLIVSKPKFDGGREWLEWLKASEYAIWFVVYAAIIPQIGYLIATLLICVLLAARLGYRSQKWIWTAFGSGLGIVIFFRVLLGIYIPPGALYKTLPAPLSSILSNWF